MLIGSFFALLISLAVNLYLVKRFQLLTKLQRKVAYQLDSREQPQLVETRAFLDRPILLHARKDLMTPIAETTDESAVELPSRLVIPRGCYRIADHKFDMKQEGLYRYLKPPKFNAQRIVFEEDLDTLLSSLCWIASHGTDDDLMSNAELTRQAMTSKLRITCGRISKWAAEILQGLGIQARLVVGLTAHQWNRFDDGHTLIEIFRPEWDKWVLYDLDKDSYFLDSQTKSPLSLIEFCQAQKNDDYEIVELTSAFRIDSSGFANFNGYDYSLLMEYIRVEPRMWYKKVMQVPVIFDQESKKFVFFDQGQRKKLELHSADFVYLEESQFLKKFYPNRSRSKQPSH